MNIKEHQKGKVMPPMKVNSDKFMVEEGLRVPPMERRIRSVPKNKVFLNSRQVEILEKEYSIVLTTNNTEREALKILRRVKNNFKVLVKS